MAVGRNRAQNAFVAYVDAKMKGTVWTSGGCKSWYLDARGRNSTLWPSFTFMFMRRVEPFNPSEYVVMARSKTASAYADRTREKNGSTRLEVARA